jgi:30S ribosomal protein S31
MGKGDKKTKRGKIIMGSYGVRRPKKKGSQFQPPVEKKTQKKKSTPEKAEIEEKAPTPK